MGRKEKIALLLRNAAPKENFLKSFLSPPTRSPSLPWFPFFSIRGISCRTVGLLVWGIPDIYTLTLITQPKHGFVQGKDSVLYFSCISPHTHTQC